MVNREFVSPPAGVLGLVRKALQILGVACLGLIGAVVVATLVFPVDDARNVRLTAGQPQDVTSSDAATYTFVSWRSDAPQPRCEVTDADNGPRALSVAGFPSTAGACRAFCSFVAEPNVTYSILCSGDAEPLSLMATTQWLNFVVVGWAGGALGWCFGGLGVSFAGLLVTYFVPRARHRPGRTNQ